MVEHHTVSLNDVQLHYAEAPGPEPALVVVHGLTGSHAEFLHLVPELAGQNHVYLLDLRGHGLSSRAESGYRVDDYGPDVAAFLREVVGQPVVLVGHSLGGLVAVSLAARLPHLFRGLFLADPALYVIQMPRFRESAFYPYFSALRDYLGRYHANGASLEAMVAYVGGSPADEERTVLEVAGPEAVRERAIQLQQMDPAVLEPALDGTLFGPEEPDALLAQIRSPVHLLAAEFARGGAMTVQDVRRAVSRIPHCTYAIVEGAGHDIHLDRPEVFLRELKQFLRTIRESERPERSRAATGRSPSPKPVSPDSPERRLWPAVQSGTSPSENLRRGELPET